MTATAAMIAKVRLMVNEPDDTNGYTDALLTTDIETYPLIDERGEVPFTWDTSTSPPTQDANEDWIVTYDLHAAAALVWEEKAGAKAHLYTFRADGGNYNRTDVHKMFMENARYHLSRRSPNNITAFVWPAPKAATTAVWVGNLAEPNC